MTALTPSPTLRAQPARQPTAIPLPAPGYSDRAADRRSPLTARRSGLTPPRPFTAARPLPPARSLPPSPTLLSYPPHSLSPNIPGGRPRCLNRWRIGGDGQRPRGLHQRNA